MICTMKPIWIVDDDQSIRFVLERALQREGLVTRSFTEANQVLAAMADAGCHLSKVPVSHACLGPWAQSE